MDRTKVIELLAKQFNDISLRMQRWLYLAINMFFAIVSYIVYRNLVYVLLISGLIVVDILTTIITLNKIKNEPILTIVLIIHIIISFCLLNFLMYGVLSVFEYNVWWIFFIIVGIESISVIISFIISIKILIPKAIKRGNNKTGLGAIAPGAAGFVGGTAATFLFKLYKPSINVAIYFVVSSLCLLTCIFGLGISIQSCRLYLIKKYKVSNDEIQAVKDRM